MLFSNILIIFEMKQKMLILCLLVICSFSQGPKATYNVVPNYRLNYPISAVYVNKLAVWYGADVLKAVGVPGYAIEPIGYNIMIYSFFLCDIKIGPVDIALFWKDPTGFGIPEMFGPSPAQARSKILDLYHGRNMLLAISSFGSTENPTTQKLEPVSCGQRYAQHVIAYNYDMVDSDYEDSAAFENGSGEAWMVAYQQAISKKLPMHIISHAPQAPYFYNNTVRYPKGAYLYLDKVIGSLIDVYLMQFYNQETTRYESYQEIFYTSGGFFPGTSVFELVQVGVPANKIVVGKPATVEDAYNTGYVTAKNMRIFFDRAYDQRHWYAGLMIWQYSSDPANVFANTALQGLRERCARDLNCF